VVVGRSTPYSDYTNKRQFSKLHQVLPSGTKVYVKNSGEIWTASFTPEGFKMGNVIYKTPNALGVAFAGRITPAHPNPNKPSLNCWLWIKVAEGPYARMSIGKAYDLYFATH